MLAVIVNTLIPPHRTPFYDVLRATLCRQVAVRLFGTLGSGALPNLSLEHLERLAEKKNWAWSLLIGERRDVPRR